MHDVSSLLDGCERNGLSPLRHVALSPVPIPASPALTRRRKQGCFRDRRQGCRRYGDCPKRRRRRLPPKRVDCPL